MGGVVRGREGDREVRERGAGEGYIQEGVIECGTES